MVYVRYVITVTKPLQEYKILNVKPTGRKKEMPKQLLSQLKEHKGKILSILLIISIVPVVFVSVQKHYEKVEKIKRQNRLQCSINMRMSGVPEELGEPFCECISEQLGSRRITSADRETLMDLSEECRKE